MTKERSDRGIYFSLFVIHPLLSLSEKDAVCQYILIDMIFLHI